MTQTVIDNATAAPLEGLPPLEHEAAAGEIRLVLLPPGRVDFKASISRHLIDVNLNSVEHRFAMNSDRRERTMVPAESVSFWPRGTEFWLTTENVLPGCVLEVGDATMRDWLAAADLEESGAAFLPYWFDPVGADLGRAAIRLLMGAARGGAPADRLTIEALALGIAARAMARLGASDGNLDAETHRWARRGDDRRVRRAADWAEAHLGDPTLAIADMAAAAGLSPSHLASVFRAVTGESPYAYVLRRRAAFARDLVTGSRLPLALIAHDAGFSSQAHMTTALKRLCGATPGAMRSGTEGRRR